MRRREFVLTATAIMAAPGGLRAQQKAMPVIGFLYSGSTGSSAANVAAFRQGLSETGYVDGENVAIEYRWAEGRFDRPPELAADLVARNVDVIAALSSASALAAKVQPQQFRSSLTLETLSPPGLLTVSPDRAATSRGSASWPAS